MYPSRGFSKVGTGSPLSSIEERFSTVVLCCVVLVHTDISSARKEQVVSFQVSIVLKTSLNPQKSKTRNLQLCTDLQFLEFPSPTGVDRFSLVQGRVRVGQGQGQQGFQGLKG